MNSMKEKHICIICGEETTFGCQLCCACEDNIEREAEYVEYEPGLQLIPSNDFAQNMMLFFQEFFARPENQSAFERYIMEQSAEPSLSYR